MNAATINSPQYSNPDSITQQSLVSVVTDLDLISYFLSDPLNQMNQFTAETISTNKMGEQNTRRPPLKEELSKIIPLSHSVSSISTVGREDALLPLPRRKSLALLYQQSPSRLSSESCCNSQRRPISATDTTSSDTTLTSTKSQGVSQSLGDSVAQSLGDSVSQSLGDSVKRPRGSFLDNQDIDPALLSNNEKKRQRSSSSGHDSVSCESRGLEEERTDNMVESKEVEGTLLASLHANLRSPLIVPPLATKVEHFSRDTGNDAISTHVLFKESSSLLMSKTSDTKEKEDLILPPAVLTGDIISLNNASTIDPQVTNTNERNMHCHGASVTNMKVDKKEQPTNDHTSANQKDFQQSSCIETSPPISRSPFLATDHSHRESSRWDQSMESCPEHTTVPTNGQWASKPFEYDYGSATAGNDTFQQAYTFHCNAQDSYQQQPNAKDERGNPVQHYASSPMTSSKRDCHEDQTFDSWQVFMERKDTDEEARARSNSWPQGIPKEKSSSFRDDSALHQQAYHCDSGANSNMYSQQHHYQDNQRPFYDSNRGPSNTRSQHGEVQDYGHGRNNETSSSNTNYHREHRQYDHPTAAYDFGTEGSNLNDHSHPRREHSNSWPSSYPPVPPLNEAQYLADLDEDVFSSTQRMSNNIKSTSAKKGTKKKRAKGNPFKTDYAPGGRRAFMDGKVPRIAHSSYDAPPLFHHGDGQHQKGYTPGFPQYCHPVRRPTAEDMQQKPTATSSSRVYFNPSSDQFPLQPYYNREIVKLSTSEDESWLSEFLCFVRSQCVEVFSATKEDVASRMNSKKVLLHQVGIRCRFCAHIPHRERSGRSSSFPSSISRIYQSLTMMLRDHFTKCHAMPHQMKERYLCLKANASQGATDSKKYWIESAHTLGLTDTEEGIRFASPLSTMD